MFLQKMLSRIAGVFTGAFKGFVRFGRKFGWVKVGIGILVLIIALVSLAKFLGGAPAADVSLAQSRTVSLKSVADLSSDSSPLSIAGTVSSLSEATVHADAGGQITSVNYALGDYVAAGSVIASVDNASQRAAVAQAQGAVDGASAGASISQTSLSSAKQSAANALLSAYGTTDKAVHADTDPMFSNPNTSNPQFSVQSSDSQSKINAENLRSTLNALLAREAAQSSTISASADLTTELNTTLGELRQVRDFLDSVLKALNSGIPTNGVTQATITADIAVANGSRSAVVGAISSLTAAQQAIETASKGADTSSGTSAAGLAQAQAGLAAARANLEKTIVRAPISGTLNSFSLKRGDYLSPGAVAAVIANNGALEVVAYITDTDAKEIVTGGSATIQTPSGTVMGTVTRIAPAIDPVSKKIEVRVGVTSGEKNLTNGQSVTVSIARATKSAASPSARITLPLSALKVGSESISVFTVDEKNALVPHTVTLGTLLGDRVVIESGLTADMMIVTDARGLQPGQTVVVK